jgi:hypothetical protein
MNDAWESLDPEGKDISANVAQLVEVMNPDSLPYPDALGEPIHTSLRQYLILFRNPISDCRKCARAFNQDETPSLR